MATAITLARMALVIPFAACFFIDASWGLTAALAVFLIAAATDFLDGRIARARGEVSALGGALDPLADKLLVAAALLLLVRNGVIRDAGVVAALIILLREFIVSGLREAVTQAGDTLPVTRLAKWKTGAQMTAAAALIAAAPGGAIGEPVRALAAGLLWLAAVLTFWTGAAYARSAVRILRARR